MHISMIAIGTQGDVQPYVALGLGLKATGHQVCIVAYSNFETFVRQHGLEFQPLGGNYQQFIEDLLQSDLGRQGSDRSGNPVKIWKIMRELNRKLKPWREEALRASAKALQHTDVAIHNPVSYACFQDQELPRVPMFAAYLSPFSPTHEFPSFIVPSVRSLGRTGNWLSHHLAEQVMWQSARPVVNEWRKQEQHLLPMPFWGYYKKLEQQKRPILYGYSPSVLPKPGDWNDRIHVTGFWFMEQNNGWQPPSRLMDFLASGPPPVVIGFSSASTHKLEAVADVVLKSLAPSRQRAVFITSCKGLNDADLPDYVLKSDYIPHDWLFPRSAAVIHHGGAGTFAAALRAGIPSIAIPVAADQPFWAKRMAILGVAPEPILSKDLSVDRLQQSLGKVLANNGIRHRAAEVGQKIASENGVANAVEILNRYLQA